MIYKKEQGGELRITGAAQRWALLLLPLPALPLPLPEARYLKRCIAWHDGTGHEVCSVHRAASILVPLEQVAPHDVTAQQVHVACTRAEHQQFIRHTQNSTGFITMTARNFILILLLDHT